MVCCISNEERRETEWIRGTTQQQTKHMYCTQTAPKDSCSNLSEAFQETVAGKKCPERWNDKLAAMKQSMLYCVWCGLAWCCEESGGSASFLYRVEVVGSWLGCMLDVQSAGL